jgi:hypothetical protein
MGNLDVTNNNMHVGCRYLVHANGICAGYSLLSAVLVAVPRPTALRAWTFFFLDQVIRFLRCAKESCYHVPYIFYNKDYSNQYVVFSSV